MIFCVETDNNIRNLMLYTLDTSGFRAKGVADSIEFWKELQKERPELILLDSMLSGEAGIFILKKLRADIATCDIPIIMVSGKGNEYEKALVLNFGADDYLGEPFGMMEMISSVKSVLCRCTPKTATVLKCGSVVLYAEEHSVRVDGNEIVLSLREFELLHFFLINQGLVFTRNQLLDKVWGMDYMGEPRTVDVYVCALRTKLGSAGSLIDTVRGVGYRMGGI